MMDLIPQITTYLESLWPQRAPLNISNLKRFTVGAAQETYRFDVTFDQDGKTIRLGLVLRRSVANTIIDTDLKTEFLAYQRFQNTAVPVPKLFAFEEEPRHLGGPFMVMAEIAGCQSSPFMLLDPTYAAVADKIGAQKWQLLGEIARADPKIQELDQYLRRPAGECWQSELDLWANNLKSDCLAPQPLAEAAIRWLYRNPPPPPSALTIVHGDFRSGNLLYNDAGEIRAVLDWEMCHLGDPLEDLAWACGALWSGGNDSKPGRLISIDRALTLYQDTSGLTVDPDAFFWWRLFSCIKGMAIWQSSAKLFEEGTDDPMLARIGWQVVDAQNKELIRRLNAARGNAG